MNNTQIIERPKLYFDKYKYKAVIHNPVFHLVRYTKTPKQLIDNIEFRSKSGGYFFNGRILEEVDTAPLLKFIDWRNNNNSGITIRIDYNKISIYGNDLDLLKTIELIGPKVDYSEVKVEGDPEILLRYNPKHPYRTYFKSKSLNADFHQEMQKFLKSYEKSVFPCGALCKWAYNLKAGQHWKKHYLEACFFVEYDNESIRTLLGLTFDQIIGKTYKVEQRD